LKVLVVYYSMYGNMFKLAKEVARGSESVKGAEVRLRKVTELVPQSVIDANPALKAASDAQKDVPIATNDDLVWADGIVWGSPTRYGNMAAQMKNFIDQTGKLWAEGALIGKPAGFFTGSATPHGGQETTLITMMIPMLHQGMVLVGVPYSVPEISAPVVGGGSPYGASAMVGQQNQIGVTENDLKVGFFLGVRVAEIAGKLRG